MRAIDGDALIAKLGIGYDCCICEKNNTPYCRWNPNAVDVCEAISDAPTIEPERKTGKWIIRETAFEDIEATCSCCGFETLVNEPGNGLHMVDDLNYCPNCGAYMKGEPNED